MDKNKRPYDYMTFGELFNEITFDYECQYEPEIYKEARVLDGEGGTEQVTAVCFYKTTMFSNGTMNRKGNTSTFDPALFWKVELMAKLLMDDPTVRVLYGS